MKCYTQLEFGRNYLQACNGVQLRGLLVNFACNKHEINMRHFCSLWSQPQGLIIVQFWL